FDTGRLEPNGDAVRAQRALVGFVIALGDARNVERAAGDAVAATDAVLLVEVHDAVGVLDDRTRGGAGLHATRILTMHPAILADQPLQVTRAVVLLRKAHQRPGARAQIVRVLVLPGVGAALTPQVVPLHAGDLAGFAADTLARIDELGDRGLADPDLR